MASGAYQIFNKMNGKIYVGSSIDLDRRKKHHFNKLKANKHGNKHLQSSFNKYGESAFEFSVRAILDLKTYNPPTKQELLDLEQFYLDMYFDNHKMCYNDLPTAGSPLGCTRSEGFCQKLSEDRSGEKNPMFGMTGEKNPMFGKRPSEEIRKKQSERMTGEKHPLWNKHPSAETLKLQSESHIGLQAGEKHPNAKLNNKLVAEMREKYKTGNYSYKQLASYYNVCFQTIWKIINNKAWKI